MGFIKEIYESKQLRNQRGLGGMSANDVAENIYLNILALQTMRNDPTSMKIAQEYAKKTMMNSGFNNIRTTGTDLHNWIAVLNEPHRYVDVIGDVGRRGIPIMQTRQWLRQVASGNVNPNFDKQFLMSLERNLQVSGPGYSATRRLVSDWHRLSGQERKMGTTRLIQALRTKSPNGDLRSPIEKFVRSGGYEIKGAKNPSSLLGKAAAFGVGYAAASLITRPLAKVGRWAMGPATRTKEYGELRDKGI